MKRDQEPTHINPGPIRAQLSPPLVKLAIALFAAGVVLGGVSYLNRSTVRVKQSAGTAAWWPHIVLFALTVVLAMLLLARRRRAWTPHLVLLAPLGRRSARRVARSVRSARHHPSFALRLFVAVLPTAMLAYLPVRAGMQVIGGLDPNFTANAWGGPSYLGALACHYLDAALLGALAAALLNLVLLPSPPVETVGRKYSTTTAEATR